MMRHTVCEIYFYKINFLSPTLFFLSHSAITFLLCKKKQIQNFLQNMTFLKILPSTDLPFVFTLLFSVFLYWKHSHCCSGIATLSNISLKI